MKKWIPLPTLDERATEKPFTSAVSISSSSSSNSSLTIAFADGNSTQLSVSHYPGFSPNWLLHFSLNPKKSPLGAVGEELVQAEELSDCFKFKQQNSILTICKSNAAISIENESERLMQSAEGEIAVGNVPQCFPVSKNPDGLSLSWAMQAREKFYGGGEDFGPLVKNGRAYNLYNADALGVTGTDRYQNTPIFQSSAGYIISLLHQGTSFVDFGCTRLEILQMHSSVDEFSLLILAEKDPKLASRQMRRILNSHFKPEAPGLLPSSKSKSLGVPDWSYELWLSRCFYRDQKEVEDVIRGARERDIPFGTINLDARAWMRPDTRTDFVWDTSRFDPAADFIASMRRQGIHLCLWESPYVSVQSDLYQEGLEHGYFALNEKGETLNFQWVPQGLKGFPVPPPAAIVDFTNPLARAWWQSKHESYLRLGVQSFKTDFGEEIPANARFFDGTTGAQRRNSYSDLYNLCVSDVVQRIHPEDGIIWARSGSLHTYTTPVKWGGDSQTNWRSLRASLRAQLSQCVAGAIFWSHDIGGFYGDPPDAELYLRWLQMTLWLSHARCHGTTAREPWEFGDGVTLLARQAIRLRHEIIPYLSATGKTKSAVFESFVSPIWHHETSIQSAQIDDQFFCGDDVMVAPFVEEKGGRTIWLPQGQWRSFTDHQNYQGQTQISVPRTDHIPVFYRSDSKWTELFKKASENLRGTR